MSNEIQVFNNAVFGEIRIIMEDGKPLFCGKDVAVALGYSNFRDALSRHCKGVVKRDSLTKGGVQSISYIQEGDLYRLIAHSQLPDAERFESWVFDDVLPSIRKMKNDKERNTEMGNELSTTMSEQGILTIQGIRCYEKGGVVFLNLEDVARGLGFTQEKNGVEYVRWETVNAYLHELGFSQQVGKDCSSPEVGKYGFPHKWGKNDYIPENIFYRLCMKGKNDAAEAFQAKVADEVIPQIRKTGAYLSPVIDSTMLFKMAEAMAEKERRITALEAANQSMLPKAEFYDAVTNSPDTIDMAETAKVLNMGVGRNTIFKILRQQHVLNRNNIPYQEYIDRGYFRCIESKYTKADGTNCVNIKTVVFQKGVDFIRTTVNNALTEQKEGKSA